jgi:hypothetical protein
MSSSHQYNDFGFEPEEQEEIQEVQPSKKELSEFGFEPEKEKVGKAKSIMYGAVEGLLGLPALVQYGVNEWSKALEKGFYGETKEIPFEEENPILATLSEFPESEDESSRRLRVGTSGVVAGSIGGLPGIVAGLVGSQAGQTVRELYGKEGKFEEFGAGEVGAIAADLVAGLGAGIGTSLARSSRSAAINARNLPAVFEKGESFLERTTIKNLVQGERSALDKIVDQFSGSAIQAYENQAERLSPLAYTELESASLAGLQRQADNMFRANNLQIISPLDVTPEVGGRAIQQAANATFQESVITAESTAYNAAREAAKDLSGEAPRTVEQAKILRSTIESVTPTGEQNPVVTFLDNLISDLEITTPARQIPASKLLGPNGQPLIAASTIEATTEPAIRRANDLVKIVQNANQAVNYGSEVRKQSHRLKPLLNTLRGEVGEVLNKNPIAANLYNDANTLHARNAETWGTKFMRSVRFTENPETIVSKSSSASNLRNLKQAVPNQAIQGVAERLVVDNMTRKGGSASNLKTLSDLSPELSLEARNAANQLINVKDPLTTIGARAQVRNQILKEAAQSINTGKKPTQILKLMETPKGYDLVREALHTGQAREAFNAFERLFIEDVFNSLKDTAGKIDFSKATNIFKNREIREVVERIGGPGMVRRFEQLQQAAQNFEKNMALYSQPQTQSLFRNLFRTVKDASMTGALLHALHIPWSAIVGLGLVKGGIGITKMTAKWLQRKILSNPEAMRILETLSQAKTTQELAKQLPRLIDQINKKTEEK